MIEARLTEQTCRAVKELYGHELNPASVGLEKTKKEITGDYTIVVFPLLKISRKSPEATASELGASLKGKMPEIDSFHVIKGFLNLVLSDSYWMDFLVNQAENDNFGFQATRNGPPVVLEYSSPNTNKPLHLGHVRNNLLGYSIAEILKANGHQVVRVNLVNDRGIHICKSMLAYMRWGDHETPESSGMKGDHLIGKYYVLFEKKYRAEVNDLTGKGFSEKEAEQKAPLIIEAREILRKWEARDPETLHLWQTMNSWAYEGFNETYSRLGVGFDHTCYESQTYLLGKEIVMEGLNRGLLVQKDDGSIWADLSDEGLDEKLLMRADGTSVYMTQDIGTAQLRFDDYQPASMIYVVGNEQNYHFDVLKRVLLKLGKAWASQINHLSYGMVELPEGKMKSREGTVVDADDLMDEMFRSAEATTRELGKANLLSEADAASLFNTIGLGALKYFILKVDPRKNMLFDPKESIDFNGNTGPFIQYTYARIQSLLAKAAASGFASAISLKHAQPPLEQLERETIKRLCQFRETVSQAGEELSPAIVANYVFDLAKGFNQFYQELPVLKEDIPEKVVLRICISKFTGNLIRRSMNLLGIAVPERM